MLQVSFYKSWLSVEYTLIMKTLCTVYADDEKEGIEDEKEGGLNTERELKEDLEVGC